jgi:hypothetical protein
MWATTLKMVNASGTRITDLEGDKVGWSEFSQPKPRCDCAIYAASSSILTTLSGKVLCFFQAPLSWSARYVPPK